MSKKILIAIIIVFLILTTLIYFILINKSSWGLTNSQGLNFLIAAVLAMVLAVVVELIYKKFSFKSNFSKTTVMVKPRKLLAQLVLPNGNFLTLTNYERIIGREDFVGLLVADQLLFIGKKHCKLTRFDDGFYIEDLETKNGTIVNKQNIKGLGKIKLKNNDIIELADTIKINYEEKVKI